MERQLRAHSPLRVSFIGGGTDISPFTERYGGAVLNTTINMGVSARYVYDNYPLEIASRDLISSYLSGAHGKTILDELSKELSDGGLKMGKIHINGDVPPGSGLASSSALVTALTALGSYASGKKLLGGALALKAYNIERNRLGILLGYQDPYAIAIGGFKFMEFRGLAKYSIERFRKSKSLIDYVSSHMLLAYTGSTRESSAALREQVTQSKRKGSKTTERLLHLKQLAFEARDCVRSSDIAGFTQTINKGWNVKKELSSGVSNKRIESLIALGMRNGALAGRLLGGGSDGFVMFIVKDGFMVHLQKALIRKYKFVVRASINNNSTEVNERKKAFG